jgi:predicted kinase
VDGTFLRRQQRDAFRSLAADWRGPFAIVEFSATQATLQRRVDNRHRLSADASEADRAVLAHQIETAQPLEPDERPFTLTLDTEAPPERSRRPEVWQPLLDRFGI